MYFIVCYCCRHQCFLGSFFLLFFPRRHRRRLACHVGTPISAITKSCRIRCASIRPFSLIHKTAQSLFHSLNYEFWFFIIINTVNIGQFCDYFVYFFAVERVCRWQMIGDGTSMRVVKLCSVDALDVAALPTLVSLEWPHLTENANTTAPIKRKPILKRWNDYFIFYLFLNYSNLFTSFFKLKISCSVDRGMSSRQCRLMQ